MFTFDGTNKLIYVDAGTTTMPASTLYTEWLAWSLLPDNTIYPIAVSKLAGENLGYGQFQSDYYKIMNGWKIVPYNGNYTLVVSGNLFGDAGAPIFNLATGNIIIIIQTASNSVTTGPLGLTEVEHNHLMSLNPGLTEVEHNHLMSLNTDVMGLTELEHNHLMSLNTDVIGRISVQSSGLTSVERIKLDYIYAIAAKLDSKGL